MTIVEFYDKTSIENIAGALSCKPDKVIFIGNDSNKMKRSIERYETIAKGRGQEIVFEFKSVSRNDIKIIIDALSQLIIDETDCAFDLSGGEDLYLVAAGIVAERNKGRVKLHYFNVRNGTLIDCDEDGNVLPILVEPQITIRESILAYGGRVIFGDEKTGATQRWNFDDAEFATDIENMWTICKDGTASDKNIWNNGVDAICRLSKGCEINTSKEIRIRDYIAKSILAEKYSRFQAFIKVLSNSDLITTYSEPGYINFTFKNDCIAKCLTKAGQILELYITLLAKREKDDDGSPYFSDVMTGVYVDWDGKVNYSDCTDVQNEVDVILMRGYIPIFISCKNGAVSTDELYKLSSVAEKFGGKFAKKVLIVSDFARMGNSANSVIARAQEMGVTLIKDIDTMDVKKLIRRLKNI